MELRFGSYTGLSCWIVLPILAACSSVPPAPTPPATQGDVKAQELAVPASQRYEHSANVEYIQALAYPENVMPAYPAELLARRLPPTTVTVRLVVGPDGTVAGVESLDPTTTPERDRLFEVVREACLRWKFSPLVRLDLDAGPTTVVEDGGATTYKGRPTALPFHLDYAFNFSQHDGRPQVDVLAGKPVQ